ncbi:uncharacterized protein LOC112175830 [Rosa chinensis]|uniref:uncharacterized protein LOC112175830 n=1 Tax=Rosa chinensis TaxID=74649 RepID=UPI001AD92685|nr:uncharacterized protein LOC112175830 [Rosa chinensis]
MVDRLVVCLFVLRLKDALVANIDLRVTLVSSVFSRSASLDITKAMHSIQSQAKARLTDPRIKGNQELEEKMKNNNDTKVRPNNREVIITVYVESDSLSYHPIKKINPNTICRKPHQTATTRIYDRRAHLLAYAQELRKTANSQQVHWPKNGSKPKHKEKNLQQIIKLKMYVITEQLNRNRFTTPVRLRRPKGSRGRYQRLVPEVDIPCNSKWNSCSNRKATESKRNSNMMRKLRCMLRGLMHCNKGSQVERKHHQAD